MWNIRLVLALYENKGSKLKYITINYKWFLVGEFLRFLDVICSYFVYHVYYYLYFISLIY